MQTSSIGQMRADAFRAMAAVAFVHCWLLLLLQFGRPTAGGHQTKMQSKPLVFARLVVLLRLQMPCSSAVLIRSTNCWRTSNQDAIQAVGGCVCTSGCWCMHHPVVTVVVRKLSAKNQQARPWPCIEGVPGDHGHPVVTVVVHFSGVGPWPSRAKQSLAPWAAADSPSHTIRMTSTTLGTPCGGNQLHRPIVVRKL